MQQSLPANHVTVRPCSLSVCSISCPICIITYEKAWESHLCSFRLSGLRMPTKENEQCRKPTPICTSLITYTHHADVTLPPPSLESKLRSLRIRRMHHINFNISLPANPVQGPSAEERTKITILPRITIQLIHKNS